MNESDMMGGAIGSHQDNQSVSYMSDEYDQGNDDEYMKKRRNKKRKDLK